MFEKGKELKKGRSVTWWRLLLVAVSGLCILWAPFTAAAQSSGHCPVYVEKLHNINSLAERTTNELGRVFAEKLAEMYTLADQSCQAHIRGNAYFEEGSPRADFEYQRALDLDEQILEKIGAIVPTFGVTAELKAKLEEAQRLYSQQVNFYAQSNQLSAQAGMAYRIGNRAMGALLLSQSNSANDSANQLEDRAFALLEEAAELLCQSTEQREGETGLELGQVPAVIAVTPPEGEYMGEGPIEECPQCPREQGGPAEITDQGIQVLAPIFGVSEILFDQVTDCETGEEIDPSLLQTEFVFSAGATPPYDLSDLEKVVLKAEGYEDRQILDFTPMQLSFGFVQLTALVPRERDICLATETEQPACECITDEEKKRLTLSAKLHHPPKYPFLTGPSYYSIEIPSETADRVPTINLPCGTYTLKDFKGQTPCGCCNEDKCQPKKVQYTPETEKVTVNRNVVVRTLVQTNSFTVKKGDTSYVKVKAKWRCEHDDCKKAFCHASYLLRFRGLGDECECRGVDFSVKVTNNKVVAGNPADYEGTYSFWAVRRIGLDLRPMGTKKQPYEISSEATSKNPLKWRPGDTLKIKIGLIDSYCWCCNEHKAFDGCRAEAATKTDQNKGRPVSITCSSRGSNTLVSKKWFDVGYPSYEIQVDMEDPKEKVAYFDFEISYNCKATFGAETCKDREDTCKEYFRIVLGQPAPPVK